MFTTLSNFILEKQSDEFSSIIPQDIYDIAKLFHQKGFKLYVVGGAIRDFIVGKAPKDFDLATDATPDEVEQIVKGHYKTFDVGKAFGVSRVVTKDEPEGVEIATFRSDIGKGRRPDAVEFTDIETDVKRRDLTINSLFYDIESKKIVDLVGGISDLQNRVVRTVGEPSERFDEDPLRKLRAVRFAARLGSDLDDATSKAILNDPSLEGVSEERIRDEFLKGIKTAKSVVKFMQLLEKYNFLQQVFVGFDVELDFIETKNAMALIGYALRFNNVTTLKKQLNTLRYKTEEIREISFWFGFSGLSSEIAFELNKSQNQTKVTKKQLLEFGKLTAMNRRLLNAYLKYTPSVNPKKLMDEGFKGKALGDEIRKREQQNFEELL